MGGAHASAEVRAATRCGETWSPLRTAWPANHQAEISWFRQKEIPHSRSIRLHLSLGAFVIMLDHWHTLPASSDGKTIFLRMRSLGPNAD